MSRSLCFFALAVVASCICAFEISAQEEIGESCGSGCHIVTYFRRFVSAGPGIDEVVIFGFQDAGSCRRLWTNSPPNNKIPQGDVVQKTAFEKTSATCVNLCPDANSDVVVSCSYAGTENTNLFVTKSCYVDAEGISSACVDDN